MAGNESNDDEFWQIALETNGFDRAVVLDDSDDDNAELGVMGLGARPITYKIPWRKKTTHVSPMVTQDLEVIPLKLSPLPDTGISSPLGAQAWHASSLLVAFLLQNTILRPKKESDDKSLFTKHLDCHYLSRDSSNNENFTALELGSGAVGLTGIVLGLLMADYFSSNSIDEEGDAVEDEEEGRRIVPRVILTDNEPSVLKNLQKNVDHTLSWVYVDTTLPLSAATQPRFQVEHLDWDHYDRFHMEHSTNTTINLVIGSELVYTHATAHACAKTVLAILQHNHDALIFILQVTDRDGWSNIFLPILRQHEEHKHVQVVEEDMHNSDLHELASTIVPPGGTLDRFVFGACYIFHKQGVVASLYNNSKD